MSLFYSNGLKPQLLEYVDMGYFSNLHKVGSQTSKHAKVII